MVVKRLRVARYLPPYRFNHVLVLDTAVILATSLLTTGYVHYMCRNSKLALYEFPSPSPRTSVGGFFLLVSST